MKHQKKHNKRNGFVAVGVLLLVGAAVALLVWQGNIAVSQGRAERYVCAIREIIPAPQSAVPQEKSDNSMPILSLDTTDFIGLLEMPRYETTLPVCSAWGRIGNFPCRFDGNVYERTLQIGATSQRGQFDFYREICVGDAIFFTDVQGNRYTYTVSKLRYAKHADRDTLVREQSALTVFIKNVSAFEYLIVSCDVTA